MFLFQGKTSLEEINNVIQEFFVNPHAHIERYGKTTIGEFETIARDQIKGMIFDEDSLCSFINDRSGHVHFYILTPKDIQKFENEKSEVNVTQDGELLHPISSRRMQYKLKKIVIERMIEYEANSGKTETYRENLIVYKPIKL
ncbi:MAG: hypothetical protein ACTSQI_13985 [Candidatus Helarchaeota archaeon]